ncbi:hypothetical protein [Sphingomonas asaccharolytica]|uniref:hypothetical protein n=1 Tax=Sphingomonas asaccharolytica TaxID=40681 RepID=UPI00082C5B0D|nr:hypothetical protein [Sphingomonas asaccharolytica]
MRRITLGTLALIMTAPAIAQQADPAVIAAQKDAVGKFAWMDGTWRGTATTRGPNGEHKVTHTERIGTMLGGTLRVIEGRSFNANGSIGFNAFAVISYDSAKKAYDFRSYALGHAGDFVITPTADGYVWEIPAGPATIRYTATLKDKVWTEIGERVVPGRPAVRFFEMHLTRVGDATWPDGGAMTP